MTHAFFDRRWPVRWLLGHIGSKGFAELKAAGMNGTYLTDQALHHTALLASALLITGAPRTVPAKSAMFSMEAVDNSPRGRGGWTGLGGGAGFTAVGLKLKSRS
ncbi:hypothetical protein AB0K68_19010 [Streptomyces sp. NPDC050698]